MITGYQLQKGKGRLALIWRDFPKITGRRCASVCGKILFGNRADGPFSLQAKAWAVRGIVP